VHGMENTEMIILQNNNGTLNVTDYYSVGFQQPTQHINTSLTIVNSVVSKAGIFANFTRPLQPSSSLDLALSVGLQTEFSFAYLTQGGEGLVHHNNQGVGLIVFGANNLTKQYVPNGSNNPYFPLDQNFYIGWVFDGGNITFTFNVFDI
jgi:hypothetical protein